jgi:hypothetical protein
MRWQLQDVRCERNVIYLLFSVSRPHDPRLPESRRPRPTEVWTQLVTPMRVLPRQRRSRSDSREEVADRGRSRSRSDSRMFS